MNAHSNVPVRISNTDMIKNILQQKKELEMYEKEILRKNRYKFIRLGTASRRNRCFSGTPDVRSSDLVNTKELKMPKHVLSEECGLIDQVHHGENSLISVHIKKVSKPRRSIEKNAKIVFLPQRSENLTRLIKRSNTPMFRRKNSLNRYGVSVKHERLFEWKFTPL